MAEDDNPREDDETDVIDLPALCRELRETNGRQADLIHQLQNLLRAARESIEITRGARDFHQLRAAELEKSNAAQHVMIETFRAELDALRLIRTLRDTWKAKHDKLMLDYGASLKAANATTESMLKERDEHQRSTSAVVRDLEAEITRLQGEVANRNQRALDGDKANNSWNQLYLKQLETEVQAAKAADALKQARSLLLNVPLMLPRTMFAADVERFLSTIQD